MPTLRETLEQIRALADAALADQPAPTPTPEPEPEQPPQVSAIATVTDNNGGEWEKGVSK